jgi:MFS transporter, ACS family, hexuronate transporter
MTHRRWVVLALLFVSTVLNYVDRQALSILASEIQRALSMTTADYARVVQMFLGAYIVGYGISGWLTDKLGTKLSLALFVAWWSLANMATGFVQSVTQLGLARTALGLGEAGNYTAAPKAVAEHFPAQERGLAVGIYTAGAMIGATLAPILIGWIALKHGWRAAFVVTGAAGFVWLIAWWLLYRPGTQPKPTSTKVTYREMLRDPSIWMLASGRLISDPVWYFYLFWFPKYLGDAQGMTLMQLATWAWIPYLAADIGSIGGGWASGKLVQQGLAPQTARLRIMAIAAMIAPVGVFIGGAQGQTSTLALAACVTFAHLMFLANHTALITDRYPSHSVGTAFGLMGMASGLGGILSTYVVGQLVGEHSYAAMFFLMACLHPIAWTMTWLAIRRPGVHIRT